MTDTGQLPSGADAPATARRKADHIRINLQEDVAGKGVTTGLERYRLVSCALPELDLAAVDTTTEFLGHRLAAPLLISCMTGGVAEAGLLNHRLATAAQAAGVAMGLGSARAALEDPGMAHHFQVRSVAPDVPLLANLGAVQLNYGYTVDHCRRAVDMIEAQALVLHLNALQEALQEGGNTNFSGLLSRIEAVCRALPVPVIVKEVGWGIHGEVARKLRDAGVAAVDVAGAGGTSWSEVERHRAPTPRLAAVAAAFAGWGQPTADCIVECRRACPDLPLITSGGLRTGVDAALCIALGADLAGFAGHLLRAAAISEDAAHTALRGIIEELRIAMFASGAGSIPLLKSGLPLQRV